MITLRKIMPASTVNRVLLIVWALVLGTAIIRGDIIGAIVMAVTLIVSVIFFKRLAKRRKKFS
jgi:hypothetical protein